MIDAVTEGEWPAQFRPVLRKLVADGREYFGFDRIAVEPVRQLERPFSTLLQIRVAPENGGTGTTDAFVKILKPRADTPAQIASMRQNVLKDFEITSRVQRGLAIYPGLTAVRPIACFPEDLAIVTERADGATLSALLARGAAGWPRRRTLDEIVAILIQVGAWLRAAQAALPQDGTITRESLASYLDRRLDELQSNGAVTLTDRGRASIAKYRDRLLDEITPHDLEPVWIHADFCPENIIARDGGVAVLDFTMAKSGTVYTDLAHLYLRMDTMKAKPWFRPRVVDSLQHALLDAFEPGLTVGKPLFSLMLLQHVICHLVVLHAGGHSHLARLYGARLHRRHRDWLKRVASLDEESWRPRPEKR